MKFRTYDSKPNREESVEDTIVQITSLPFGKTACIYGLSENGNVYKLNFNGWEFWAKSPIIEGK